MLHHVNKALQQTQMTTLIYQHESRFYAINPLFPVAYFSKLYTLSKKIKTQPHFGVLELELRVRSCPPTGCNAALFRDRG